MTADLVEYVDAFGAVYVHPPDTPLVESTLCRAWHRVRYVQRGEVRPCTCGERPCVTAQRELLSK